MAEKKCYYCDGNTDMACVGCGRAVCVHHVKFYPQVDRQVKGEFNWLVVCSECEGWLPQTLKRG